MAGMGLRLCSGDSHRLELGHLRCHLQLSNFYFAVPTGRLVFKGILIALLVLCSQFQLPTEAEQSFVFVRCIHTRFVRQ